ncbi:hypothetical protein Tco_0393475 [Tanacetum coccineum]
MVNHLVPSRGQVVQSLVPLNGVSDVVRLLRRLKELWCLVDSNSRVGDSRSGVGQVNVMCDDDTSRAALTYNIDMRLRAEVVHTMILCTSSLTQREISETDVLCTRNWGARLSTIYIYGCVWDKRSRDQHVQFRFFVWDMELERYSGSMGGCGELDSRRRVGQSG